MKTLGKSGRRVVRRGVNGPRRFRERGAALLVVAITIVVVGVLAAVMMSLLTTSSREQVMAGFTNEAFCLAEAGARSVSAHITNAFYNVDDPATPEEALGAFGRVDTSTVDGVKTVALVDPDSVVLAMSDAGRTVSVSNVVYSEQYDATDETTTGTLSLTSTGHVNAGTALEASVRNRYEITIGMIPGPHDILDWAVWAGHGGLQTSGRPSGVDSVPNASAYDTKDKIGEDVPKDGAGNYICSAPVVSDKPGSNSIDLQSATLYANVTAAGDVTPDANVKGTLAENRDVPDKLPVVDLGTGRPLTDLGGALTWKAADTIEVGAIPSGVWRYDGGLTGLTILTKNSKPLRVTGDATLFVTGGGFFVNGEIAITSGARLTVVASGPMSFPNNSLVNHGGSADKALFYGTKACSSVSIQGCPSFVGVVYTPTADITIGGGSSVLGSVCGRQVGFNGNSRVTFDISLQSISGGASKDRYHTEAVRHLRALVVP